MIKYVRIQELIILIEEFKNLHLIFKRLKWLF